MEHRPIGLQASFYGNCIIAIRIICRKVASPDIQKTLIQTCRVQYTDVSSYRCLSTMHSGHTPKGRQIAVSAYEESGSLTLQNGKEKLEIRCRKEKFSTCH